MIKKRELSYVALNALDIAHGLSWAAKQVQCVVSL